MSFDYGSIPAQVLREITKGLITEEVSLFESIATPKRDRTTLSGSFPRMTNGSTMSRAENSGLAPGARAKPHGGALATVTYNCLAYVGYDIITDEERNDVGAYGEDLLANRIRQARADANLNIDLAGATALASTTFNETFTASNTWDDYTNGTPLEDMLEAKYTKCPGADMIVYGPGVFRALQASPDLLAEVSNYSAGQLDFNGLNAILAAKLNIPVANIHFIEKYYNSAVEGQTEVTAYVGNGLFWMGRRNDFLMIDPVNADVNNLTEVQRIVNGRSHEVQHTRYVDFVRPTKQTGCVFASILT